ncbi:MAG: cytochrome c3 family protein [Chloroflexota bacterium]
MMDPPKRRMILMLGFLLVFALALAACSQEPETVEVTRVVEVPGETTEVEVTRVVETEVEVEVPAEMDRGAQVASEIVFVDQWASSGHNDVEGEAFNHWNEDDPAEVSASCAKCHSTPGYLDFLGEDGTEFGSVENAAPIGTTVECQACHNETTLSLTSVVFPSGIEVHGLGDESRCMQCHQGRQSTVSVNQSIADAGLGEGDEDTVSEDLGFSNIHYYAAAATLYGTEAKGGYEYDGKAYDAKFDHVEGYDSCIDCHNPHTLEVNVEQCSMCHTDVETVEDLVNVRMPGSLVDYDGDGDMEEGIMAEIQGMQELLYGAMQAYATEVTGGGIVYDAASYPYFFDDAGERYASWTPRLAKAAYNYQVSQKDPGEYAHGGKYIIQLLYDSTESLNEALAEPVDLSMAHRIDHGHFAGSEEAFRHWDEEGAVPGSCSRCHSAAGLPLYLEQGAEIEQATANGLNCATCHNDLTTFTLYESDSVEFPSGVTLSLAEVDEENGPKANLCLNCHQGRAYGGTVDARIGELGDDEIGESLSFVNVHYFPAGSTLFGSEAQVGYQYEGNEYVGRFEHVSGFDTCVECHDAHALEVVVEDCGNCHDGVSTEEDLQNIRVSETDFDGDGDVTEGMAGEVATLRDALIVAMNDYTAANEGVSPIVYDPARYPYFFDDAGERYATWTPALLRAAYNYQYATKDPGGFAHNGLYVLQLLYDSLVGVGGDVTGMTRPS